MNLRSLKEKYSPSINHPKGFLGLVAELLEKHFDKEYLINTLFNARQGEHQIFSVKEYEIVGKQNNVYSNLLSLCRPECEDEFESLYNQMCTNHFDLSEVYAKQFYIYGHDDAKLIKEEYEKRNL